MRKFKVFTVICISLLFGACASSSEDTLMEVPKETKAAKFAGKTMAKYYYLQPSQTEVTLCGDYAKSYEIFLSTPAPYDVVVTTSLKRKSGLSWVSVFNAHQTIFIPAGSQIAKFDFCSSVPIYIACGKERVLITKQFKLEITDIKYQNLSTTPPPFDYILGNSNTLEFDLSIFCDGDVTGGGKEGGL